MTSILVPFRTDLKSSEDTLRLLNSLGGGPKNPADHIWNFDSEQPPDHRPFPPNNRFKLQSGIYCIAPFSQGRLMIWRRDAEGSYTPASRRVILALDSNIFYEVQAVLVDGKGTDVALRSIVELARHAQLWRAEQQPLAYLREIVLHSPLADTRNYAIKAVEGILRLGALDVNNTEFNESPVYHEDKISSIQRQLGHESLIGCSEAIVDEMYRKSAPGIGNTFVLFYTAFLKMISVGLTSKKMNIESKVAIVDDFVTSSLGAVQPRFFALTRLFFSRQLSSLFIAQPGNDDFDRSRLIGTAYDVYLSTIHEEVLGDSDPPESMQSILCTRDSGLADYAGRFPLRAVAKMRDTSLRVLHAWDDPWVKRLLGDQAFDAMNRAMEMKLTKLNTPQPPKNIRAIITSLEDELRVPTDKRLLKPGKQIYVSGEVGSHAE